MIRDVFGLTVGTLTRVPVPAPKRVDRQVSGWMMSLAPLVGALLGGVAAAIVIVLSWRTDAAASPLAALLIASLVVAFGAWVTRGMHLDGLADMTDALGSWKPPAEALEVAKRSDIGPFGVIALVLAVLVQATSLAILVGDGRGPIAVVIAFTVGRIAAPIAARRSVPAARPDGLGAASAGTVPTIVPIAWTTAFAALAAWLLIVANDSTPPWAGAVSVVAGALSAAWVVRVARKRLGGMTGDVIGAAVEAATTVCLLALALLA